MRTLVLGLGNELAGDDAVGVLAARAVREDLADAADVVESSASGMALIEVLAGYERAVVVDAIMTGKSAPGTITEMGMDEVGRVVARPSWQPSRRSRGGSATWSCDGSRRRHARLPRRRGARRKAG